MDKAELEAAITIDPLLWAHLRRVNLRDGIKFSLEGRPYLNDLVTWDKRVMSIKKGTQVGATTTKYLQAVHACLYRHYEQNVIYMMPTVKQVEMLAKVSFDPIFDFNPWLKKHVADNTASMKKINGRSIIFVGAQAQKVGGGSTKDSANLRTFPADCVMRDELDLMDMDMVDMSKQRLNNSMFRHEVNFGSPTYPGYGIDFLYEQGDQRKWQIKCKSCGKYTCLVDSFPNSIINVNGKWIRACIHCNKEIFTIDGCWQSDFPDRRESSYWVDGLLSPRADLEEYMFRYYNTDGPKRSEFMRSILGVASTEAENQLTEQDVIDTCTPDAIRGYSEVETVMGIDVGKTLHCVTGVRTGNETYAILNVSRCENFEQVHELAKRLNVRMCVIDSGPYDHKVREFQKSEPYAVYLCMYSEQMPGKPKFDSKSGMVKCNRNEWCDKVHEVFTSHKISIPHDSYEVKEFALELTKTAKSVIENPETGIRKPRWIKLGSGDDHYFHSTLYFLLGCMRSSPKRLDGKATKRFTHTKSDYRMGGAKKRPKAGY